MGSYKRSIVIAFFFAVLLYEVFCKTSVKFLCNLVKGIVFLLALHKCEAEVNVFAMCPFVFAETDTTLSIGIFDEFFVTFAKFFDGGSGGDDEGDVLRLL